MIAVVGTPMPYATANSNESSRSCSTVYAHCVETSNRAHSDPNDTVSVTSSQAFTPRSARSIPRTLPSKTAWPSVSITQRNFGASHQGDVSTRILGHG